MKEGCGLSIFSGQESFLPAVRPPGESDGYSPTGGKEEENSGPLPLPPPITTISEEHSNM